MRQFDVFDNPSPASGLFAPFVVVLQSHYLRVMETVVVAPLVRDGAPAFSLLDVEIEFDGEDLVLQISEIGAAERRSFGRVRGDVRFHEDRIRRALDRLFTGF